MAETLFNERGKSEHGAKWLKTKGGVLRFTHQSILSYFRLLHVSVWTPAMESKPLVNRDVQPDVNSYVSMTARILQNRNIAIKTNCSWKQLNLEK